MKNETMLKSVSYEDITTCSHYQKYKDTYTNYRIRNKEKFQEWTNKYKEKNKYKINCPCGSSIQKLRLKDHEKSKKHQRYLMNQYIA